MKKIHFPTVAFYGGLALVAIITLIRFANPNSSHYNPRILEGVFIVLGLIILFYRMGMARAKANKEGSSNE